MTRWLWLGALAVLVVAAGLSSPLVERLPVADWGAALGETGVTGAIGLVVIGTLATAIGLPRQLIALIAGYAFGTLAGLAVALPAALGGCALSVHAARGWLRDPVKRRFPVAVDRLSRLVATDTFLKILVLRLQPLGTNLVSNLAAGVIGLPLRPFLAASFVGYVPQTLVFVLIGSGVRVGSRAELVVGVLLLGLSVALGLVIYRRQARVDASSPRECRVDRASRGLTGPARDS